MIRFEIPDTENGKHKMENGLVTLRIYDNIGREIETLVKEELSAGTYEVQWNAGSYPSGTYFYRLTSTKYSETKKMVLLK
jgi:flagellar hook assembly protein FlgD